jgi:hypothetical protein
MSPWPPKGEPSGKGTRPAMLPRPGHADLAGALKHGLADARDALEFTFEARDGKTLMTMAQRGFPTAELREEHERGVPNAFARLDRLIQLSGTPTDARHDSAP